MSQQSYMLCVFWGQQTVPSVEVSCSGCGAKLAIDVKNANVPVTIGARPICFDCVQKYKTLEFGGSYVGGRRYSDFAAGARAAAAAKNRN